MALHAQTFTVGITDTVVTLNMTTPIQVISISNIDTANAVWIKFHSNTAAVAEADDNVYVRPGETIVVRKLDTFRAIAIASPVKINVWGTDNL